MHLVGISNTTNAVLKNFAITDAAEKLSRSLAMTPFDLAAENPAHAPLVHSSPKEGQVGLTSLHPKGV